MFAQDVLPRPALRRAAGEHGGEPADHVTVLGVDRSAFLLAHGELVERATGAIETGTELLPGEVAGGGRVGEAAEFGGLDLESRLEPGGGARIGRKGGAPREHQGGTRRSAHGERHHGDDDLCVHDVLLGKWSLAS